MRDQKKIKVWIAGGTHKCPRTQKYAYFESRSSMLDLLGKI